MAIRLADAFPVDTQFVRVTTAAFMPAAIRSTLAPGALRIAASSRLGVANLSFGAANPAALGKIADAQVFLAVFVVRAIVGAFVFATVRPALLAGTNGCANTDIIDALIIGQITFTTAAATV